MSRSGVSGGRQVGYTTVGIAARASLWSGTAASWVDLHPADATDSSASGVSGGQQVGVAYLGTVARASLWTGTAASWVDLTPAGADFSEAQGVDAGQQVGNARFAGGGRRASLWSGTAASWVDLHVFLPAAFGDSEATGISHDGDFTYVVGYGTNSTTGRNEALMWVGMAPVCCAGDFDGNHVVTNADIPDFVTALLAGGACPVTPACCPGDFNSDGMVDGTDIPGFVAKLLAGGACP